MVSMSAAKKVLPPKVRLVPAMIRLLELRDEVDEDVRAAPFT
ncbi:hypothetical protein AWB68_06027 [Caballeronia choica]|jgi:hypothetical protein|uniref:Uncharacterized protein n=1 Tax=Caballeronia choica TaxID=326476 RepID=A0A158KL12_9BURK|nr:hypothetical protein AWB68_06027 [Caballeronia choica]